MMRKYLIIFIFVVILVIICYLSIDLISNNKEQKENIVRIIFFSCIVATTIGFLLNCCSAITTKPELKESIGSLSGFILGIILLSSLGGLVGLYWDEGLSMILSFSAAVFGGPIGGILGSFFEGNKKVSKNNGVKS